MSVAVGIGCAALGLLIGPFLAGLTLRVPAEQPILAPGAWHGAPAGPARTTAVSALTAAVLGALGAGIGAEPHLPAYLWLGAVGVTLAVIDLDCFRLPDRLTLPSFPVGAALLAAASAAEHAWAALGRGALAAAALGGTFLLLALAGRDSLGLGDVKLGALLGLYLGWLGWDAVLVGVVAGFAAGSVAALVLLVGRRVGWKGHLAFGPWLLAGALVGVVAGRPLLHAYLGVGAGA